MIEQDTRFIIDNNLINKGWILDINDPLKNVFFENDILRIINDKKLKKLQKRPDYVLINENRIPIAVIEAKAGGKDLEKAIEQAKEYAKTLNAPLIFAMNGAYCLTRHLYADKPLYINENEVNELIGVKEANKFIEDNTNSIYTIPKNVILSRQELINIFRDLNDSLRSEGLRAGIERLSEFANILFLKLYTENKAENLWNNIKKVDDEILIRTVEQTLKHIEKNYGASVFTDIQIKKSDTLRQIVNKLDNLTLSTIDTDIKGDAFEYFLQQAAANNNDLGEYFTPRHIVKTVINMVKPRFKETIYDPFCGTGGFLTECFNYIKENTIINTDEEKNILKEETIFGNELTNNSRLAKMNMILHGDGHSGIKQQDSLENPIDNKYDIVVTNMPFSQKTEFSHLYYNGLANNKADSVCVLHCFKSIKKGGRIAIIVPEGFLFNKQYEKVRQFLLNNSKLQVIISLPQGVFLPYTGVKTDILFFTDCKFKKTENKIWYFYVKNDGFSLNNQREKIKENDLKKVDYLDFKKNTDDNILDIGFISINYEDIKKNNYNLVLARYIKNEYYSKYHMIKLKELVDLLRGPFGSSIKKSICVSRGYKVYEQGNIINNNFKIGKYYIDEQKFNELKKFEIKKDDVLITCAGTLGKISIVPNNIERGIINSVLMRLRIKDKNIILPKYLKLIFESDVIQYEMINKSLGTSIKNMRPGNELKELLIPVPNIETQQKIIKDSLEKQIMINNKKKEIEEIQKSLINNINSIWCIKK
ncbi:MAG: N-6 DNA methylase [Elusimicrobiota bacterium]|jgi:type I restriction enzyme M protein|nr:N-6 DNA methylase [Elusimicrobiota bacterium]